MATRCSLSTFDHSPSMHPFWGDLRMQLKHCGIVDLPTDSQKIKAYVDSCGVESIEKIKERFQCFLEGIKTSEFGYSREFACYVPSDPTRFIKITTCFRSDDWQVVDRTTCIFMGVFNSESKGMKKEETVGNTRIQFEGFVAEEWPDEWSQLCVQMKTLLSFKQRDVAALEAEDMAKSLQAPYEG